MYYQGLPPCGTTGPAGTFLGRYSQHAFVLANKGKNCSHMLALWHKSTWHLLLRCWYGTSKPVSTHTVWHGNSCILPCCLMCCSFFQASILHASEVRLASSNSSLCMFTTYDDSLVCCVVILLNFFPITYV